VDLKKILHLLVRWLVVNKRAPESFTGEIRISVNNGIPSTKYKKVVTEKGE